MKPLVSVLVLNHNHKENLKIIFDSVRKLNKACRYETFLVDNGSVDGSEQFTKKNFPEINIIQTGKNLGTPAFNLALPKVKGDYVIWVGCDTKFHKDSLYNMVKVFQAEKDVAGVYPNQVDFSGKGSDSGAVFSHILYFFSTTRYKRAREWIGLGPGMIRTNILKKIGYIYDQDYFYSYEDIDLGLTVRLLGMRVVLERSAIFYHRGSVSFKKKFSSTFRIFLAERNSLMTFFKILEWRNIVLYLPYNLLFRLLLVFRDVLTGQFSNAFARIRAVLWFAAKFGFVLKKRSLVQKLRKVSDKEIFKPIADEKFFVSAFIENVLKRESFDIYKFSENKKSKVK
jgi:GT2 family glycosyltransferase